MSVQVVIDVAGDGGLSSAASGDVATVLADAFDTAREALSTLPPGGGILFRCQVTDAPALTGALTSLCRGLAREAAPLGVRVNAVIGESDVDELVAFLGSPAATMCTGAVLETV